MATTEDFTAIVRKLNEVQTAGQARAAAGAVLKAISPAYDLAKDLPSERRQATTNELNGARVAVEEYYRSIETMSGTALITTGWPAKRKLIERGYLVVGGIEAEAGHKPQTSNLSILGDAIAAAPSVFVKAVGQAAGAVAKEAGAVAGSAVSGILGGLGVSGVATLVLVLVAVVVYLKRGTLIGRLLGGGA